jgi:hypothetical protein
VINWVLATTQLDLSVYAKEIAGLMTEFIKHKEPVIRAHAHTTVTLFAKRCSDSEAAEVAFAALVNLLTNKAEKVTQSDCRVAVYGAIGALADAPLPGVAKTDVSFTAIVKLLEIYSKESVEPSVLAGLSSIRAYAAACGGKAHCPELVSAVTAVLADVKASVNLRCGMLHCLLESFQGDHAAAAAGVCPAVLKAFRAAKGASASPVRFLAAAFLMRVANADPNAPSGTEDAKFAAALTDDRAGADKFFGKFSDVGPQVELIELCLQSSAIVGEDGDKGEVLYDALMTLLSHESWKVRQHTRTRVQIFLRNVATPPIRLHVIDAFCRLLATKAAALEDGTQLSLGDSSVLADAFDAVAVIDGVNRSTIAARLLLPGHHPLLRRRNCWSKAVAQCGGGENAWTPNEGAAELVDAVCAGMTLELTSACRAVHTLARRADSNTVVDGLANKVLGELRDPALQAVSPHDVDVLNTPPGTLSSEHKKEDDEMAALNPNSKDYEEQLWELKTRRELARKKGQDKPAKKLSKQEIEKRKAKLDEEAGIRKRVAELHNRGVGALRVAVELSRARGTFAALRIACATPMLFAHAPSPLLASAAYQALLDFGKSIDPRLRYLSEGIVVSVLRSSEATAAVPAPWMQCSLGELTARTMRRLWAVTNDAGSLDVPSFGFCWPLLQHILMRSSLPGAVLEDALVFLTSHPDLGASPLAPRRGVLRLLAHVATNHEVAATAPTMQVQLARPRSPFSSSLPSRPALTSAERP